MRSKNGGVMTDLKVFKKGVRGREVKKKKNAGDIIGNLNWLWRLSLEILKT